MVLEKDGYQLDRSCGKLAKYYTESRRKQTPYVQQKREV